MVRSIYHCSKCLLTINTGICREDDYWVLYGFCAGCGSIHAIEFTMQGPGLILLNGYDDEDGPRLIRNEDAASANLRVAHSSNREIVIELMHCDFAARPHFSDTIANIAGGNLRGQSGGADSCVRHERAAVLL
jgi:hypothetical protein